MDVTPEELFLGGTRDQDHGQVAGVRAPGPRALTEVRGSREAIRDH